jgi:hypothetical protein
MDNRVMNKKMLENDIEKIKKEEKPKLYEMVDGNDAVLLFGAQKGSKISDLIKTVEGKNYLIWILEKEFPKELQDLIRKWWDTNVLILEE